MSENYNENSTYQSYGSDSSRYNTGSSDGYQSSYSNSQTYYNGQPYSYEPNTGRYEQEQPQEMTIGKWLLTFLLCIIPIVNIIMLIVWAGGSNPKDGIRKTWARAQLIWMVIMTVISTILVIGLTTLFVSLITDSDFIDAIYEEAGITPPDTLDAVTLPDTSESKPVVDVAPDGTWKDMTFRFDGNEYTLPFAYSKIAASGWTFDMADYGYENGYVLNPGQSESMSIQLQNPAYDYVWVTVDFINESDTVKDITECSIYSFSYNYYGEDDERPDMSVSGGISLGMSKDDALAIMGDPEDTYESDDYSSYYYSDDDYSKYLNFDVSDSNVVDYISLTYYTR